jgi:hypothetical protein
MEASFLATIALKARCNAVYSYRNGLAVDWLREDAATSCNKDFVRKFLLSASRINGTSTSPYFALRPSIPGDSAMHADKAPQGGAADQCQFPDPTNVL